MGMSELSNVEEVNLTKTAFGALNVAQLRPYVLVSPVRGLEERLFETYTSGTASFAGAVDNAPGREFGVSSGTSVGGYGVLRSKKVLSYKPGIGSLVRFTGRFSAPAANAIQRVGLMNIGNELSFGYNGTTFGILHKSGGRPEMRTLTITNPANSNQTLTVTLNGSATSLSVTNGTAAHNAFQIAATSFTGWIVYNIGSTVVFEAKSTGAKTGTYSVTSTGGFTGTFAQTYAGATETDNHIPQSTWNKKTLLNGDFILDPSKGNVFQVQFQYLGYGCLKFYVENPNIGAFELVHEIQYANANTRPHTDLPEFKLGIIAASLGSTTNVSTYTASMAGFWENQDEFPSKVHSVSGAQSGIGTTLTNVLAIKKTSLANDRLHITDQKMYELTASSEATKPVFFEVRLNPTFSAETQWESVDEDVPIIATSTGGTVSGGELVYAIALSKSSNIAISLDDLDIIMSNDDVLSIAAKATNGTVDANASIVWGEP